MDLTKNDLLIVGLASGHVGVIDLGNDCNFVILGEHNGAVCKVIWV